MKFQVEKTLSVFFLLGILFIPLNTLSNDWQYKISYFIFQQPIEFLQNSILKIPTERMEFSSDSLAFNLLLIIIFLISILISFFIKKQKFISFARSILTFYLIFILLKYGIDKIMGTQFYTPEPNILYSNFGNLDKDILFWSVTGLSKTYCIITGIIEILTGILLFFRKTRLIGLLISVFILIQILVINFSFDISVKSYSLFLLAGNIFLLFPYLKPLKNIFFSEKLELIKNPKISFVKNSFLNLWIQFFLIGIFCIQILYPYWNSSKFNQKDKLHGAYEITEIIYKKDTLPISKFPYRRVFFHKDKFLILQKTNDEMRDFYYRILPSKNQIELTDYQQNQFKIDYNFNPNDSILELNFIQDSLSIKAKSIDWQSLRAMKDGFHFTVDEVK